MTKLPVGPFSLPQIGWNVSEVATDEVANKDGVAIDNDNSKSNGRVYSIDNPGVGPIRAFETEGGVHYFIRRFNAQEFVRFKFGPKARFSGSNYMVEGSRGSARNPWHLLLYARRGHGHPEDQKAGPLVNEMVAKDKITNPQAFVRDSDIVSASTPHLVNRTTDKKGIFKFDVAIGNGTISTPSIANKTLHEGTETRLWEASYIGKSQWEFRGYAKRDGVLRLVANKKVDINKDNKTWTLRNEFKDKSLQIEVTITQGNKAFGDGDFFTFSTLRSESKGSEIAEGHIVVDNEEPQYIEQQPKPNK
jgi:hypothetical protein